MSTCINLLLPHPDDFFIVEDNSSAPEIEPAVSAQQQAAEPSDDSDEGSQNSRLREVGMVNLTHSIQLEFVPSECSKLFNKIRRNKHLETISKNSN